MTVGSLGNIRGGLQMASPNRRGEMMMYMEIKKHTHMHMCSEEYPDAEERDEEIEAFGKDWKSCVSYFPAKATKVLPDCLLVALDKITKTKKRMLARCVA